MKRRLSILSILLLTAALPALAKGLNSSIHVDPGELVDGDLSTLNGQIHIDDGAVVRGETQSVNGSIAMEIGSRARSAGTVNGSVKLLGAEVEADVSTYNGDVILRDGAIVGGDIVILEPSSGSSRRDRKLRIYVESGSTVQGNVIVEDEDLEVEVYLNGGTVAGEIRGATVVEK